MDNWLTIEPPALIEEYYILLGSYENGGIVRYKHLYFNATFQTLVIWITLLASMHNCSVRNFESSARSLPEEKDPMANVYPFCC